jgi:hydrogenase nickel incorporation protein HypB
MCVVCGCSETGPADAVAEGPGPVHAHAHAHGSGHVHEHAQVQVDPRTGDLHYGAGVARVSVPGMSQERAIRLEADVLGENRRLAALNRTHFEGHGVAALNLVSSPGSGKTTLLCATIEALRRRAPALPLAVIEGDQQTSNDADRIRASGAPAIQVNTGKGCHLDAQMVGEAFARLPLHAHVHEPHWHHHPHHDHEHGTHSHEQEHDHDHGPEALLFIENVGNLVCPAMWDLGERAKVVILSVTEGEDKPLKYPDMFAAARLMVLNKTDLLPHLEFDVARCIEYARRVNPGIEVLLVSAKSGDGMDAWIDWLLQGETGSPAKALGTEAALRVRIAQLETRLARAGLA